MTVPSVDVVVCVYNGLHHVRQCLRSLRLFTEAPYHLVVVDDGSDRHVGEEIQRILSTGWSQPDFTYLRNPQNEGYLPAVNRGIGAGNGEFVVLLNSDTLVTPGWLAGLLRCLATQPEYSIACPLSNHANFSRVDFPPGSTFLDLAHLVRRLSSRTYPEIGLASGFCLIARRSLYDLVGRFDEAYGGGYFEESDLCMRAAEQGGRVVADDATFVYHHGWGSFGPRGRDEAMKANRQVFERRWGRVHELWYERFVSRRPFADLETAVREQLPGPPAGRMTRSLARWQRRGGSGPVHELHSLGKWQRIARRSMPRPPSRGQQPRVLFLLPALKPDSISISVAQLVNRLLLRGLHAQIATHGPVEDAFYQEQLFFRPASFSTPFAMARDLPPFDIVVSTHWETVYEALLLKLQWGCRVVRYVPDPLPLDLGGRAQSDAERLADELVERRIVHAGGVADDGALPESTERVPRGLNRDIFYPSPEPFRGTPRQVTVMTGPDHPDDDAWGRTVEALEDLAQRRDDVVTAVLGPGLEHSGPSPKADPGTSHVALASLLRRSSVLVEVPTTRTPGWAWLPAMACGVPTVVAGAVDCAYARHEQNCLMTAERDADALVGSVERLLDDRELARELRLGGLRTVSGLDAETEADEVADLLRELLTDPVPSGRSRG